MMCPKDGNNESYHEDKHTQADRQTDRAHQYSIQTLPVTHPTRQKFIKIRKQRLELSR